MVCLQMNPMHSFEVFDHKLGNEIAADVVGA